MIFKKGTDISENRYKLSPVHPLGCVHRKKEKDKDNAERLIIGGDGGVGGSLNYLLKEM